MSQHWNIQIGIQRVEEPEPINDKGGYPIKAVSGRPLMSERKVVKVVDLAITADGEKEAYAKAHRMLSASEPEPAPMIVSARENPFGATYPISEQAGARRALKAMADLPATWVPTIVQDGIAGYTRTDIRAMINLVAQEMGLPDLAGES